MVEQNRCLAARRPRPAAMGLLGQPTFVDEDDRTAFFLGFFLAAGQVCCFHSRMAASFPLQRATDRALRAPVQPAKNLPDMTRVVADVKLLLDQIGDALAGPQWRLIAEFLGTSQQTIHKPPVLIRIEPRHPPSAARLA